MTIPHSETFFRQTIPTFPVAIASVWPSQHPLVRQVCTPGLEVLDYATFAAARRDDGIVDAWVTGGELGTRLLLGVDHLGALVFFSDADADQIHVYDLAQGVWLDGGAAGLPRFVLEDDGVCAWVTDLQTGWRHDLIEATDTDADLDQPSRVPA